MFPISDVIPSRTRPFVTISLIALNALAFLYEIQLTDYQLQHLAYNYGVLPSEFEWTDVVTSMFLHDGWIHFLGNMLYLWIFGDNVEDRMGHGLFILFYVLCGAIAAVTQVFVHPFSIIPMIGASGAIAGVMGAYFVLYPRSRILTAVFLVIFMDIVEIPALFLLGFWFLMQLFSGVGSLGANTATGGTAFWAHVGGFAIGVGGGLVTRFRADARREYWRDLG